MKSKKQILVVEDNQLNREMLVEILSDQYAILQAENGQEALEILKNYKDSISLILLDVMMPVMDGYTFLNIIKKNPELSLIPVIVTTQSGSEEDEITALMNGATDFVPKPYRPQVILHRVASIIKLRETAAMVNQFQYDRLTGLYTKSYFCHKVRQVLEENPDRKYSIICSNIENFKLYNDVFGFKAGDRLLKEVAATTKKMVGTSGFCGRFGADHFLYFLEREQKLCDYQNFYSDLNKKLPLQIKNIVIRWGIYEIDDHNISIEQMCDRAQLAATSIKGQYSNFFAVYDDSLRGKLLQEKAIEDAMENALAQKQFIIYLQPKYSLEDEIMTGAETLVRWNHPEWGCMSPGEFIPLFEKNGFIYRLDKYVWEQACSLLCDWKNRGIPLIPVSVNVSRADLYQSDLTDVLLDLTQKYGIEPGYLHLEITESAYAENPRQIISAVDELHRQGFVIEMDDFGKGYSSLNMLSQMKLNIIKLDMKFVKNETDKSSNKSILNDIIVMAHKMQLRVVAEGVETREQMQRLQSVGCDYVQGFLFAKPMPVPEFEDLMKKNACRSESSCGDILQKRTDESCLLVADEDAGYRKLIRQMFEKDYPVIEASDANCALGHVTEYGRKGIAAVILSISLPDFGAAAFLKELRQNPKLWDIPVLLTIPSGDIPEEIPLMKEVDDFLCKCHPMFDLKKRVQHLADMVETRRQAKAFQTEAYTDYLTGLYNRRGFQAAMDAVREDDLPLAVCLFDLDNLKYINDTFGHDTGDRIIQTFANFLRRNSQKNDVLCRYGGDEFVMILKHLDNPETANKKGSEICRMFQEFFEKEQISASCSCGIALCMAGDKPTDRLIEMADHALYQAKLENKGGFCVWKKQ